jgi:hypothetical protein
MTFLAIGYPLSKFYSDLNEFVKAKKQRKCHAEPCAELDSVLVQHLTELRTYQTLKQVQGDR